MTSHPRKFYKVPINGLPFYYSKGGKRTPFKRKRLRSFCTLTCNNENVVITWVIPLSFHVINIVGTVDFKEY